MKLLIEIRKYWTQITRGIQTPEFHLDGIILSSSLTGLVIEKDCEVKLVIHVSPKGKRSYVVEHTGFYEENTIRKLMPGRKILLFVKGKKSKVELIYPNH